MSDARLRLERLGTEHAPMLFDALNDGRTGRHIGGPDVTTVEALFARIEHLNQGPPADARQSWLNFAVLLDSTVVGRVEATVHSGIAEIAYLIGPRYWGRGFGIEAGGLLLEQLACQGISDCWATTEPDNVASVAVLARLGFQEADPSTAPRLLSYDDGDRVFHRSATSPPRDGRRPRMPRGPCKAGADCPDRPRAHST